MLKRVSIQNFKSLKDVTLDLQKVNLLIGPNNSGKTNFLKALEYMGKDNSIHSHESDRNKIAYKRNNSLISVQFKFDPKNEDHDLGRYDYWVFECEINPNGNVTKSNWYQDLANPLTKVYRASDKQLFDFNAFTERVGALVIYKPDPNKLNKPGPTGNNYEIVNADASNLVAFIDYILDEYRETTFRQIQDDLHKCVPEFTEINLQNVKSTDELVNQFGPYTFKRLGLTDSRQNVKYWADELSEGTLYFIALLCIINQPNPPKLLLLEEPEKGIHPRRIWEVMKFIFQLADEKDVQIILTTHNEHVVNAFASMPESVFVFDKDEETGETKVRNLQRHIIEPSHKKSEELDQKKIDFTSDLGERWMYGLIGGVPTDEL